MAKKLLTDLFQIQAEDSYGIRWSSIWGIKNHMQAQVNVGNNEIYRLNIRIKELESENEKFKKRVKLENRSIGPSTSTATTNTPAATFPVSGTGLWVKFYII